MTTQINDAPFLLCYNCCMKISIQGNIGSYSHIAALNFFGNSTEIVQRSNFAQVFDDLDSGDVPFIVVPIENSTHGSVYQNYDNLSKYNYKIFGEIYVKVHFHLIANKGVSFKDLTHLYTHPVGLNQIQKFLKENPHIEAHEYEDTAGSVEMIKQNGLTDTAAAASILSAEINDMKVLEKNIHENEKNYTRFFVIGKENLKKIDKTKKYKTTIQFELGDESGSLYKSLRCFADRDIALSKIESRPILNTDWQYRFYVDFEAGSHQESAQNAIKELESYVKKMKILGSYEKGVYVAS